MDSISPDAKCCTPQLFPEGLPTAEWLPEQLAAFVQAQHRVILNAERALAVEYWRLGKALAVLRTSFAHGQWEQFLKDAKVEKSKACRARAIAKAFTKEEELAGLTLQQAYEQCRKPRQPAQPKAECGKEDEGRFTQFLDHVRKVAEPFIDRAAFAEPGEAARLLPEVEQVLSKFEKIRSLLQERIAES